MIEVKNIKFRKERVDEFTVRHNFDAGTKHLPPLYVTKHYQYNVYAQEDGKMINFGDWRLSTLKDVKQWIADYDAIEDARLAEVKAEEERYQAEQQARKDRENKLRDDFIDRPNLKEYKVGDRIKVIMGKLSKPDSIGEALDRVELPSDAKVVHITEVTVDEYKAAAARMYNGFKNEWLLLEGEAEHKFGGGYVGGAATDEPELQDKEWTDLDRDPRLKQLWFDTNYELITLIVAPGRQPLAINTSGYGYPRYAGKVA